jgi:hypothetical protein
MHYIFGSRNPRVSEVECAQQRRAWVVSSMSYAPFAYNVGVL